MTVCIVQWARVTMWRVCATSWLPVLSDARVTYYSSIEIETNARCEIGIVTAARTQSISYSRFDDQIKCKWNEINHFMYPHSTFCIIVHSSVYLSTVRLCVCSQARSPISILQFCSSRKLKSTPITRYSARNVGNMAIAANTFAIIPHTHTMSCCFVQKLHANDEQDRIERKKSNLSSE